MAVRTKNAAAVASNSSLTLMQPAFNPSDLLPIEEVAKRLHSEVSWVREKIRRRCPNPMPVYSLGRHLLFEWSSVCAWIRETGRGQAHMKHHRTRKKAA